MAKGRHIPVQSVNILGARVDVTSVDGAARWILDRAKAGQSLFVSFSTTHMVMEAHKSRSFRAMLNSADLVAPDGLPLVWVQRLTGVRTAHRAPGPDTMPRLCELAAAESVPVALYGSRPDTIEALRQRLAERWPSLRIVYAWSPPFRQLTAEEDAEAVRQINASGARIVFVGLGCPKQEMWCHDHRGRIPAALLAVGAAFDFLAGTRPRAPLWMQNVGLEWLFRLWQEPTRLAHRYFVYNSKFVALVAMQLLGLKKYPPPETTAGGDDHPPKETPL